MAVINAALGFNVGFVNPVFYALGSSYFRDIVPGAGPADNSNSGSPGYPAGPGWDACTGWGSPNGQVLLAGLKSVYAHNLYFIVDKNTFGSDEVSDVIAQGGGLYSNAFWLVLEGFSITQLGGLQPTLSGPFSTLTGVTVFMDAAGPAFEDPTDLFSPQRIRFPYDIIFNSTSLADFPSPGSAPIVEALDAEITLGGSMLPAAALFELVAGADPYFTNVDPVTNQFFYLSQDLRVFSVAAGDTPLPGGPTATSDPYGTIQNILSFMNSSATYTTPGPDPLNALPDQTGYETGDTSVTPLNASNQQNFNFAIARVRCRASVHPRPTSGCSSGFGSPSPVIRTSSRRRPTRASLERAARTWDFRCCRSRPEPDSWTPTDRAFRRSRSSPPTRTALTITMEPTRTAISGPSACRWADTRRGPISAASSTFTTP